MTKTRLGILASGSGTNYQAIASAISNGDLNAEVSVVITNNQDSGVWQKAYDNQHGCAYIDHRWYKTRKEFDKAVVDRLLLCNTDIVVMVGWMRIATPTLITPFEGRMINLHPSLLPAFKGINAVKQALDAGVMYTGATVHYVVPELDSGPIIEQEAVLVYGHDTEESLHDRIREAEHRIIVRSLRCLTETINS